MNAAVRAVVRMGLYVGAKVYFIHEVSPCVPVHFKIKICIPFMPNAVGKMCNYSSFLNTAEV